MKSNQSQLDRGDRICAQPQRQTFALFVAGFFTIAFVACLLVPRQLAAFPLQESGSANKPEKASALKFDHAQATEEASGVEAQAQPEAPAEQEFVPDFDDQDLAQTRDRAWEYRPYQVAVWFCLDGSPALNSVYRTVALDVTRRSELVDPSGWDLTTGLAPSKWRHRFSKYLEQPEKLADVAELESIQTYDKLMIVCINSDFGQTNVRVRELDITTQQWGPVVERNLAQLSGLGPSIMDGIMRAFMPLAKIDRIDQISYEDESGRKRIRKEVVMQIRGIQSSVTTRKTYRPGSLEANNEPGESDPLADNPSADPTATADSPQDGPQTQEDWFEWTAEHIESSPVYFRDQDRMLPVIRRTDRKGNLVKLEPIEFTYLTVSEQAGPVVKASIESYHRAPLAQRKSKRAQKLALVIRPPENTTTLYLYAPGKEKSPLEGFEIWSRRPGSSIDEKSDFLGKTNWRGGFDIPPSPDGLRIIYVKRGARALRRLPVIPGLYDSVSTQLPNDETRLFAEGIITGLQNEILSLVIRREVLEAEIAAALEEDDLETAKSALKDLKDLDTPTDFKNSMSEDESLLKLKTSDTRETDYITKRFESLRKLLDSQITKSRQNEFIEKVLKLSEKK